MNNANSSELLADSRLVCSSLDDLPLIMRVEELMPILRIGRNTAYELVRSGQIKSIKIGRQLRVPKQAIIGYLEATP